MSNFAFHEKAPLDRFYKIYGSVTLTEVYDRAMVSIAIARGSADQVTKVLSDVYGVHLPETGHSVVSAHRNARIVGLSPDQLFVIFDPSSEPPVDTIGTDFAEGAYLVDQSDSWVAVKIEGRQVRDVLERICPINIQADRFLVDQVARTAMEHLGVILIRQSEDAFLMLSPRSSANSFLHVLETSATSVV